MTANDLRALLPSLERFHRRFGRFFVRSEARAWSHKYLIGLTLAIERKNVENIAEQVGAPPRKLQEFLSDSPWDEEGCIEELQGFVGEQMGSADGVLILDDTGFAKKGIWSAWVARQYSGTLGRVDNCQIGVFLGYASQHEPHSRALVLDDGSPAGGWLGGQGLQVLPLQRAGDGGAGRDGLGGLPALDHRRGLRAG